MPRAGFGLLVGLAIVLSGGHAFGQSPYSNIYNRPTVSPYLNLLQSNRFGISNYQTLVRPMIEQREASIQNQANIQQLQQQFQSGQAAAMRRGSSGGARSTGHPSRFFTYLHYYPVLNSMTARYAR
jgi:hypothetical protein